MPVYEIKIWKNAEQVKVVEHIKVRATDEAEAIAKGIAHRAEQLIPASCPVTATIDPDYDARQEEIDAATRHAATPLTNIKRGIKVGH
jgi:hypothetical protein